MSKKTESINRIIIMKYFFILIISLTVLSCGETKKAIGSQAKQTKSVAIVAQDPTDKQTPSTPKSPEPPNQGKSDSIITLIPLPPTPPKRLTNYKELMHKRWNTILQKYVSKNGNFDYKGLKKDKTEFDIYLDYLSETVPDNSWSKEEKLAYWINAYNALTVDLIMRNYPIKSIKDIKDPWDQRLWKFGNKWQNLNDIEHKILRKMNEPRIHFAIVCASVSCPKLQNKAFTASNLEDQLTNATIEFLADTAKNEVAVDRIKLSKIFKWFKNDFEQNGSLIDFLNQYSAVSILRSAKKSYKDYNWGLNE